MIISNATLRNFRKYDHERFFFHKQFTVLIGDNGAGKTTILDALAIMLSTYFQGSRIKTGRNVIGKEDARLVMIEKEGQVFGEPQEEVFLIAEGLLHGQKISWKRDLGDRGGKARELVAIGAKDRRQVTHNKDPNLPLLLYYGAGRLWDIHRNVETEKPGSQLDAYRFCLDPKSDQKAFEKWFKKLSFSELQKKQTIPALQAVKEVVLSCIPDATDFYHDTSEDQIMIHLEDKGTVPFNNLSDGYRNTVAMVADIAHRASRLNPHHSVEVAKKTNGVVLIDEIDLHLHPKWQRRIVRDLQTAFPSLQFIATTHSPFILQSLDPGEVIDLNLPTRSNLIECPPPGLAGPGPASSFSNRSIEDIVEDVMGVPLPQRSQRHQEMYNAAKAYYTVLEKARDSDEETKEALKRKLDELSAPYSDNIAYHAFLEMERIVAGFGPSKKGEPE